MNFADAIKVCFNKYLDFSGRAKPLEFWWFFLFFMISYLTLSMFSKELAVLFIFATLLPYLAVSVRRLHDTNRSGWWLLISLIPVIGFFVLIVLFMLDTTEDKSAYNNATSPPLPTEVNSHKSTIDQDKLVTEQHPWRRFFARAVDLNTAGLLLFIAILFIFRTVMPTRAAELSEALQNPFIALFSVYLIWIPAEAMFLSLFGNTPGKWLFGIRVTNANNQLLTFSEAANRSLLVWVQGIGLGIPFLNIFTHLIAYRRLKDIGSTKWDIATNSLVTHQKWSILRAIICTAIVCLIFILLVVFEALYSKVVQN
jgi:uncharacterized membrane protein YhaH (DUF805 family)